jgi:Flp pilus assembly protein TadG
MVSSGAKVARFASDRNGGVAVIFGLVLLPLVAAAGAAIDYSRANMIKSAIQGALDAAVLNTALKAPQLESDQIIPTATNYFNAVFAKRDVGPVQIDGQYDSATRTLTLNATGAVKTTLMAIFVPSMRVNALSKAGYAGESVGACVIALDPTAGKSFEVSGSGSVNVPNCAIYVNSTSNVALSLKGASYVKAKSVYVAGNVTGNNVSPAPLTNQPRIADPLANLPEPTAPGYCTYTNVTFTAPVTLPGGSTYCGNIGLNSDITFGEGIHYFKGATVSAGSSVNITGTNVMLYFDESSTFSSTSSGTFSISAPQSGTYAGVAFFGSRAASLPLFKLTGSKDYFVQGTIYLPKANLQFIGSADLTVTSKSGYVISQQFSYQGNSGFTFDAFGAVVPSSMKSGHVVLLQ